MNIICFDTEMANGYELLELTITDYDGNILFSNRFRPKCKKWSARIHGITPAMVKDARPASEYRENIRKILESADVMVGCAISNDLGTLRRAGIKQNKKSLVVDIQDMFWALAGRRLYDDYRQTSLEDIAHYCGVSFNPGEEHTSGGDTDMTLRCFKILLRKFIEEYAPRAVEATVDVQLQYYCNLLALAKAEYDIQRAAGYMSVIEQDNGAYSFKFNRVIPPENPRRRLIVPVSDRHQAETDMRQIFARKQLHNPGNTFRLTATDMDTIKNYSNASTASTKSSRGMS